MKVAEMARRLGVAADTVRFYTRTKVLQPNKNSDNGNHEYNKKDMSRLQFVLSARQPGLTVDDIHDHSLSTGCTHVVATRSTWLSL